MSVISETEVVNEELSQCSTDPFSKDPGGIRITLHCYYFTFWKLVGFMGIFLLGVP